MKYLFSHRNFPAQFRHVLIELAKNPENEILFLTNTSNNVSMENIGKVVYNLKREVPDNCHRYLKMYEEAVIHGQSAAEIAIAIKDSGFYPDVMYVHSWGNAMFFKDIFPKAKLITFFEWYYNSQNSDVDFGKNPISLDIDKKASIRCKNAQMLLELTACDVGICPTNWQKYQFPKEFHSKLNVIHDGIDVDYFTPNEDAIFEIPDKNLTLSKKDTVVTYATRGMEEYRGFPQFMTMIEKLLKTRPDVHVVIAGEDRVCYGPKLAGTTYKQYMLNKLDLDMERVHFVGPLPYGEYKKLLQISSAHIYLTYPFVLSWSMLEAMACECCIIGSKTAPVEEVLTDNQNGFLIDFFDIDALLNKTLYVLDNQDKVENIRHNARKTIVDNYDLKVLIQKQLKLLQKD